MIEQFSSIERDAFYVPYLSDKTPEAVFHGQAAKTVVYLTVPTAQQDLRSQRLAILISDNRNSPPTFRDHLNRIRSHLPGFNEFDRIPCCLILRWKEVGKPTLKYFQHVFGSVLFGINADFGK